MVLDTSPAIPDISPVTSFTEPKIFTKPCFVSSSLPFSTVNLDTRIFANLFKTYFYNIKFFRKVNVFFEIFLKGNTYERFKK